MLGVDTQESLEAVLEAVADLPRAPELFLLTGDLVQDAEAATYQRLRRLLSGLPAPAYCLPGNHDDARLMRELLTDGRRLLMQTRVSLAGWELLCLNSTIAHNPCGHLGEEELALLRRELAAIPAERPVLLAMHHSPVRTGSRWLDTMVVSDAERLFECLEPHPNVRAILTGHVHQQLDVHRGGIRVLACPSTCFQFKPSSRDFALDPVPQGYRWLELQPDGTIETGVERLVAVPRGLDLASAGY